MDDFKVLLYVVFGAIWLISRIMKSRKKQNAQKEQSDQPYEEPKKEVSFEDLLKEFTQGGVEEKKEISYEEPETYEESTEAEAISWKGSDEEATSVYEKSIRDAETIDMTDQGHNHHLKRFAVFEEEEEDTFLADLKADLSEEGGLKKAIIYKEILDRKHF
jgi:hypothetical protein